MKQSEGFIVHEKESHIGRLKKILYELKQVSKALCSRVYGYLTSLRFTKKDPNLHFMMVGDNPAVLVLYVDDLFLTGSKKLIVRCKMELAFYRDREIYSSVRGSTQWRCCRDSV